MKRQQINQSQNNSRLKINTTGNTNTTNGNISYIIQKKHQQDDGENYYEIEDTTADKLAQEIISQRLSLIYELRIPVRIFYVEKPQKYQTLGYKKFSRSMYSQFICPSRKEDHVWTSDIGYCQIWYKFQNLHNLDKPLEIPFFIELYGQKCKKCLKNNKQESKYAQMSYDSDVRDSFFDTAQQFLNFLIRIVLGVQRPKDIHKKGKGRDLKKHEKALCQACYLGKCPFRRNQDEYSKYSFKSSKRAGKRR